MKNIYSLGSLLGLLVASTLSASEAPQSDLVIRNTTIVDVRRERMIPNRDIFVDGGRIVAIAPSGKATGHSAKRSIDGTGMFTTPGLIDGHIHVDLYAWEKQADDWAMPMYLSSGVTSVRDCAGSSLTLGIRKAVESGKLAGPRMIVSSPFITSEKVEPGSNIYQVSTPKEATDLVNQFLDRGYDSIKVETGLAVDVAGAAAKTAERRGSSLFGHTLGGKRNGYGEIYLAESLKVLNTLEHFGFAVFDFMQAEDSPYYRNPKMSPGHIGWFGGAYMDFSKTEALIKLLRSEKAVLTPTMVTSVYDLLLDVDAARFEAMGIDGFRKDPIGQFLPDYYYDTWLYMYKNWGYGDVNHPRRQEQIRAEKNAIKLLKHLDDAGIPLLVGSDVPARPFLVAGRSVHEEMDIYREAGMSPWRSLRAATISPAYALGMNGKIGEVRKGAVADLLLTKQDPIRFPKALRKPSLVLVDGEEFSRARLNKMLEAQKAAVRKIPTPKLGTHRLHIEHKSRGAFR